MKVVFISLFKPGFGGGEGQAAHELAQHFAPDPHQLFRELRFLMAGSSSDTMHQRRRLVLDHKRFKQEP